MNLVAPAVVSRYGKGTDSDATDAMVVGMPLTFDWQAGGGNDKSWRGKSRQWTEHKPGQVPALQTTKTWAKLESGAVRRLTPVECERLQGLPDGWTREYGPSLADEPNFPHRTDESCPPPDSRRYAVCGDAVTANVAEWIGRRLPA